MCHEVPGHDGGFDIHFGNSVEETVARLRRYNRGDPGTRKRIQVAET